VAPLHKFHLCRWELDRCTAWESALKVMSLFVCVCVYVHVASMRLMTGAAKCWFKVWFEMKKKENGLCVIPCVPLTLWHRFPQHSIYFCRSMLRLVQDQSTPMAAELNEDMILMIIVAWRWNIHYSHLFMTSLGLTGQCPWARHGTPCWPWCFCHRMSVCMTEKTSSQANIVQIKKWLYVVWSVKCFKWSKR